VKDKEKKTGQED